MTTSAPSVRIPWQNRFRKSMMPVFLALSTALVALGLVIGFTVSAQQQARRHAMAEGDALLALSGLLGAVRDGEIGQRGYLLTGNPAYLKPYDDARQRMEASLASVAETMKRVPDPEQDERVRVNRLTAMTRGKFAEMDKTLELYRAGLKTQAMAVVQSDIGKMQMDAIRNDVQTMGKERGQSRRDAFERVVSLENRLIPLVVILGFAILALVVAGFRAERSRARGAAAAEQADMLREANDRSQLLARELNHRVKNLFAVILSIVALSGRKKAPAGEIVEDIRARIHALSRAHSASQGSAEGDTVQLGETIGQTLEPYADAEGLRVKLAGPEIELPVRMVTPIGLIVHELATNAAKYGALSGDGSVSIAWSVAPENDGLSPKVRIDWIETGGPPVPATPQPNRREGFGSRMTALAAQQLGGSIAREWPESGAIARIEFTLPAAA